MERITMQHLDAKAARISKLTQRVHTIERGSQWTQWKLCNESGSVVILRANTARQLADLIDAYREGIYAAQDMRSDSGKHST